MLSSCQPRLLAVSPPEDPHATKESRTKQGYQWCNHRECQCYQHDQQQTAKLNTITWRSDGISHELHPGRHRTTEHVKQPTRSISTHVTARPGLVMTTAIHAHRSYDVIKLSNIMPHHKVMFQHFTLYKLRTRVLPSITLAVIPHRCDLLSERCGTDICPRLLLSCSFVSVLAAEPLCVFFGIASPAG